MAHASGLRGTRYWCYVDICTEGLQFCDHQQTRCKYCSDVLLDCYTNRQQFNCTRFCMEKWIEQQQQRGECDKGEFTTTALVTSILLFVILCINAIYIVDKTYFKSKLAKFFKHIKCCCNFGYVPNSTTSSYNFGWVQNTTTSSSSNRQAQIEYKRVGAEGTEYPQITHGTKTLERRRTNRQRHTEQDTRVSLETLPLTSLTPNGDAIQSKSSLMLRNEEVIHASVYPPERHTDINELHGVETQNDIINGQHIDNFLRDASGRSRDVIQGELPNDPIPIYRHMDQSGSRHVSGSEQRNTIHDRMVGNELSHPASSNGYPALPYRSVSPADTGYHTTFTDLDSTHLKIPNSANNEIPPVRYAGRYNNQIAEENATLDRNGCGKSVHKGNGIKEKCKRKKGGDHVGSSKPRKHESQSQIKKKFGKNKVEVTDYDVVEEKDRKEKNAKENDKYEMIVTREKTGLEEIQREERTDDEAEEKSNTSGTEILRLSSLDEDTD